MRLEILLLLLPTFLSLWICSIRLILFSYAENSGLKPRGVNGEVSLRNASEEFSFKQRRNPALRQVLMVSKVGSAQDKLRRRINPGSFIITGASL